MNRCRLALPKRERFGLIYARQPVRHPRFTTLLSVLLFTPRLSEQTSSSKSASGPVLSATPPSPSDALELLAASSTAANSPSRSIGPVYLTPFTKKAGV